MSVRVKYELINLEKKFGSGNVARAKVTVANQVLLDSEQYVPFRKGYLRASGRAVNGSVYWTTVYARAHFYGTNGIVNFWRYTTPGTGAKWVDKASDKNMDRWSNVAKRSLGIK